MKNNLFKFLVRVEGLEPPRLAAPEPKSGASTNFATPAFKIQTVFQIPYQKDIQVSRAKTNFSKKILEQANLNYL